MRITRSTIWLVGALALGCKGREMSSADRQDNAVAMEPPADLPAMGYGSAAGGGGGAAMALEEGRLGKKEAAKAEGRYRLHAAQAAVDATVVADGKLVPEPGDLGGDADGESLGTETVPRAWFPETFLFEPLVVTDAHGEATVPVKVPDRLTTWRVLALGHTRGGAQGGATTSFLGTLPVYVDPVIPAFLVAGDRIRLPVQLVNTTDAPVTAQLETVAEGATLRGASGTRTVPAQGSVVDTAELDAPRAGTIKLGVKLAGSDAVIRTIDVVPSGRPVTVTRSGTLAAPRELAIEGPAGSDPGTDRVRLVVYPGALALLRAELGASTARAGVAEDAYALLLAGRAPELLAALGDKADPKALRDLTIVAAQRAIRHARTLDVTRATLLAEAALAHRDNPVLARLGERAVAYLARTQRPDGTFAGATGWTLQRVLIATADGVRAASADTSTTAARQRAQGVRARAAGAFARTAAQVTDAYTAAAILASGAIDGATNGPLADELKARVRKGLATAPDGAKYLAVPEGVVRADGRVPSRVEATALAVLALAGDPAVADLGATLLGGYTPVYGWGDGVANLACMRAVTALFKDPLPQTLSITLAMDGKPVATGTFDRTRLRDVVALDATPGGFAGAHTWSIRAEPAVPGLGYALALEAFLPWDKQPTTGGLELQLPARLTGSVGKPIEIALTAIAPSGRPIHLRHALPAGVQVDRPSLEDLVRAGQVERFEIADGKVDLHLRPLEPGRMFEARYKVIPTLAGTLRSQASLIETGATRYDVPPTTWEIR